MAAAVVATVATAWIVAAAVDAATFVEAWRAMLVHPTGMVVALTAFAGAFVLRAVAWRRILPALDFGHALAAIHVALGANHVLPLRMGEPLRVVSVARRAGIGVRAATASTITLRAADIAAMALLGVAAGASRFMADTAVWLVVAGAGAATVAGTVWLRRLRDESVALPGPVAMGCTLAAWVAESVVMWQVAAWAEVPLSFDEAVLVTATAVLAQVVAFAPGGFGTYEAGGTAALAFLGHDPSVALAVVVMAHAVKTAYSILAGAVAVAAPAPGFVGRLRLGPAVTRAPVPPPGPGPVVLFLPAHDEADAVGSVVSRIPTSVHGHDVVCVVVDDGSTDRTGEVAAAAGAEVVTLPKNRGLGAAVRAGLADAVARDAAAVAFCDADGEYAPEELAALVRPILDGEADYVVGSRFAGRIDRMLPHRRLGNRVLTAVLSWVARRRIGDGQSGYRAFSPAAAADAEIVHDFNYAQVLTLDLLAKGYRYEEVPISYSFRTTGRSFVRLGRYLAAVAPAVYRELNAPAGGSVLDDVGSETSPRRRPSVVVERE